MVQEPIKLYGMTEEELLKFVYLDESSPSGIRWKIYASSRATKNSCAGTYSNTVKFPCWRVKINKTPCVVSRVVWFLKFKEVPEIVDHKDGNSRNNSISNLRSVPIKVNCENRAVLTSSGVPGVYRIEQKGRLYWRCQGTSAQNIRWVKSFSIRKLGEQEAFEMAKAYRLEKDKENSVQTRRNTLNELRANEKTSC